MVCRFLLLRYQLPYFAWTACVSMVTVCPSCHLLGCAVLMACSHPGPWPTAPFLSASWSHKAVSVCSCCSAAISDQNATSGQSSLFDWLSANVLGGIKHTKECERRRSQKCKKKKKSILKRLYGYFRHWGGIFRSVVQKKTFLGLSALVVFKCLFPIMGIRRQIFILFFVHI